MISYGCILSDVICEFNVFFVHRINFVENVLYMRYNLFIITREGDVYEQSQDVQFFSEDKRSILA